MNGLFENNLEVWKVWDLALSLQVLGTILSSLGCAA